MDNAVGDAACVGNMTSAGRAMTTGEEAEASDIGVAEATAGELSDSSDRRRAKRLPGFAMAACQEHLEARRELHLRKKCT
jgi:hypothetical protein